MSTVLPPAVDILAFSPHPDDAELYCGGLLLRMKDLGYNTAVVDLSRGELSSQGTESRRREEARQAELLLGLALRENLGFPDGALGGETALPNGGSQLEALVDVLRRLRPEIVLLPYWQERHPDHTAASRLLARAVFLAGVHKFASAKNYSPFKPRQVLYYQMRFAFRPSFLVDISDFLEQKRAVIGCYRSQIERDPRLPLPTLISSPGNLAALEARDRYYGAMIGVSAAEPYLMQNVLSIRDPLAFFRENPCDESFVFPEEL